MTGAGRTVYEHQLPPPGDPEVVALATEWITAARTAQRPMRALAYAIPSLVIGVVIWGELYVWTEFEMHWYLMGGSAVVLGALVGHPCRRLGALFDRHWSILLGACGLAMAVIGDLHAGVLLAAAREGVPWADFVSRLDVSHLREWLSLRAPIDWVVALFAGAGAAFGARPPLDDRQLEMQARIDVAARRLAEAEESV